MSAGERSGELIAHRGYPAHYPENSVAGIQAALAAGARYVEVDVQLSRDQVPVLFHDRDLQRLCHQPGAIHTYDWEALQAFTLYAAKEALQQTRSPLASLADLVAVIRTAPQVRFFVELKRAAIEQFGAGTVLDVVLPLLQPVLEQCCLISYDRPILQQLRTRSSATLGVVIDDWAGHHDPAIVALQPEYLFCNLVSFPDEGKLVLPGSRLAAFETVDPQQARRLMARGVDLVETFEIGEMRRELGLDDD